MNSALKLILVLAAVALIAFPILAIMGFNTPLPFADWGLSIYTFLSNKVTTTMSTVYGLVGATGVSLAASVALGYAYKKIKEQKTAITNWAQSTIGKKDDAITELTGQTTALTSASALKDQAFSKLELLNAEVSGKYTAAQTTITGLQGQLQTQTEQAQNLSKTAASLLQAKTPNNTVFVDPTNPNNKVIVVEKKDPYIT